MNHSNIIGKVQNEIAKQFLKFVVPTLLIAGLAVFVGALLPSHFRISRAIVSFFIILLTVPAYWYGYQKKYQTGMLFVIVGLTINFTLGTILNGAVLAPAYYGFVAIIALTSWITHKNESIYLFIYAAVLGLFSQLGYKFGVIHPIDHAINPFYLWIAVVVIELVLVYTLVTGNKMLHQHLLESIENENLLSTTFKAVPDALILFSSSNKVIKMNEQAKTLLEEINVEEEITEFSQIKMITSEDNIKALSQIILDNNQTIKNLKVQLGKPNLKRWLLISASKLVLKDNSAGVVVSIRDISEEVAKEESLIQAQKMDAIGQLTGGIAHDFNNMLSAIHGAADLLYSDSLQNQKEMLKLIINAAEKASKLTSELLIFCRKTSQIEKVIDIHSIINETVFLLKHTIDKRINISTDLQASNPLLKGDDTIIQSAFVNMGINASHAMPKGGTLTFKTMELELDEEYCSNSEFDITPGKYLSIIIEDNGCGMPFEVQRHIFDPFFTTKEEGKGTGLGMAAVHGMVIKHRGAISVSSEIEKGTCFKIFLPAAAENSEITLSKDELLIKGKGKILIVDDEEYVRITLTGLLKEMGYTPLCVSNGIEALKFLYEQSVDIILLDMIMPVLNGRETFEKIVEMNFSGKVIVVSGYLNDEDITAMKKRGLFGIINKPYSKVELSQMLAKAMGYKV